MKEKLSLRDWLDGSPLEPVNPMQGNPFKEFAYDARHPILFLKRWWTGVKLTAAFIQRGFRDD